MSAALMMMAAACGGATPIGGEDPWENEPSGMTPWFDYQPAVLPEEMPGRSIEGSTNYFGDNGLELLSPAGIRHLFPEGAAGGGAPPESVWEMREPDGDNFPAPTSKLYYGAIFRVTAGWSDGVPPNAGTKFVWLQDPVYWEGELAGGSTGAACFVGFNTGMASIAFVVEGTGLTDSWHTDPISVADGDPHKLELVWELAAVAGDPGTVTIYIDEAPVGEFPDVLVDREGLPRFLSAFLQYWMTFGGGSSPVPADQWIDLLRHKVSVA